MEDQNLRHHRELKDGGTLMEPIMRASELGVQAHTFDQCSVEEPLLDGVEPHLHH
jgi:hypothetical protein